MTSRMNIPPPSFNIPAPKRKTEDPTCAKLYIGKEDDRLAVAAVLVKNGYTVRSGKTRRPGAKVYDYFVEYWRCTEGKDGGDDDA